MYEQLPTPGIELFLVATILGSITFLAFAIFLAWLLKRKRLFRWSSYLTILLCILVFGQIGALLVWSRWPFSFDITFGPLFLPGLLSYSIVISIGYTLLHLFRK